MTEYLTEQEQIELFKNWIKQYSLVIVAGVCLAVLIVSGWRFWQQRQLKIISHASAVYDEMLVARAQNNDTELGIQTQKLYDHYAKTPYGPFASLMAARTAALANDYTTAETELRWTMDHSHIAAIQQIARLRLARILLASKQYTSALEALEKVNDKTFIGLIEEVKGDIYVAMSEPAKARDAYELALKELPNADSIRPLLQMKYDNVVTSNAT